MLAKLFKKLEEEKRQALIVDVCCGDISIDFSEKLIAEICKRGVDVVELVVPFSDPMADGKSIQAASNRALKNAVNIKDIFAMAKRLRSRGVNTPFVLSSYFNPIFKAGVANVVDACVDSKINALKVVDVPLEEADEILCETSTKPVDFVSFISCTTPLERVKKISQIGSGFLHCIQSQYDSDSCKLANIAQLHKYSNLPIVVDSSNFQECVEGVVLSGEFIDIVYRTYEEAGECSALTRAGKFISEASSSFKRRS